MNGNFLMQAVVYLTAAVVCVPVARRLGLGSVLGYLLSGILIGPFLLGFIGEEGRDIMNFAEFGVVMMLFLVGLELEPAQFWRMRRMIVGMGTLQICLTAALISAAALFLGLSWQASLAAGLALAMSSTAIVLQTLNEKGMMRTAGGQSSFAVLLFQDISVIPILAILPLLALPAAGAGDAGHQSLLSGLPGWMQTLGVLLAVALVILAGRFVIVPLLRLVARTHLRELFTASALLIIVSTAWLMELVGLSPALGTFLAGVILANSEYRHELESDLEPFKGLLLGLFFIAVGASINFSLVAGDPAGIVSLVLGVMVLKTLVLLVTGRVFGLGTDQNLWFAFGLSQVGEFAFVLLSFINQLEILDNEWMERMMVVTAVSMTLTPLLLMLHEKVLVPRLGTLPAETREADAISEHNPVIIAGFSQFGSTIGRFLRASGVEATVLDNDSDRVDLLRKMGFKVYYGDASRFDLLESAGAREAKILISAISSPEINAGLVETVRKHFPHLRIMIRVKDRFDAYELMDMGVENLYRESVDTSVRLGVDVLRSLGHRGYSATRAGQNFLKYDEQALRKLAGERHDMKQYIFSVRQQIELQEQLLAEDRQNILSTNDLAWDSEHMRETISKHVPEADG